MPEEGVQGHIGGVGHGKIIAHLVPGQDLGVASIGDGDAQAGGLVIGRELDNLTGIL